MTTNLASLEEVRQKSIAFSSLVFPDSIDCVRYNIFLPNGEIINLSSRDDILKTFEHILKEKDTFTYEHSIRVTDISIQLGEQFGINHLEEKMLFNAALMHDVGKLMIPDSILIKPGNLTKDEWNVIYRHPVASEVIVGQIPSLTGILPAIRHHHERYDGKGYPDKLKGKKIPFHARIIALADAFDAMTTKRPYRNAMSFQQALHIISEESGKQFDPFVVKAFLNITHR